MKDTEEAHAENVQSLVGALDDLKIVGVRPKPPGLTKELKKESGGMRLTQEAVRSLMSKGFYITRDGDLLSNEGEIGAYCDDGVVYTLRFGEILIGSGEDVEAGAEEKDPKDPKKDPPKKEGAEHRYLFVTVRFDEDYAPKAPADPGKFEPKDEWTGEQKKEEEDKHKAATDDYNRKKKDYDEKIAGGRKRAKELSERFADWYYVISADYFKNLRRPRKELVREKTAPKPPDDPHRHEK
jgi:hypothetical protein